MKKKLFLILGIVLLLFLVLIPSCTTAGAELGLIGTWWGHVTDSYGASNYFEIDFRINDTGFINGYAHDNFKVTNSNSINKTVTVKFNSLSDCSGTYTYSISSSGNDLTINKFKFSPTNSQTLKLQKY